MSARHLLICATSIALCAPVAHAHPVTVDGNVGEWLARQPNVANLGIVARDASENGEFVWLDAVGDARTDLASPEEKADIVSLAMTADVANLYVRTELVASAFSAGAPPQVQIAIDLDRIESAGEEALAGFPDTSVARAASWEFLLQTRATPTVRVLNTTYTVVGNGSLSIDATGRHVEMSIPWTLLGLTGPPSVARFTVASFRENVMNGDVVDVLGNADALDTLSDYGDPRSSTYPNSWDEVGDGIVNYFFDVFFESDGDVRAPIVIERFQSATNPPGYEFFWIRNQSESIIDLAGYSIGDEETPDGPEAMGTFASTVINPGGSVLVAKDGTLFFGAYLARADAEFDGTDAGTADLLAFDAWSTTRTLDLDDAGDELLVLGPDHIVLDVVTWGSGTYPGITPVAAPGYNEVALRDPQTQDTDDNAVDFGVVAWSCANDAGCEPCRACGGYTCLPVTLGTECEDGDPCTLGTTCQGPSTTCTGGSRTVCDDDNACTINTCNAQAECIYPNEDPGTNCGGSTACTLLSMCDGSGACIPTPRDCADANPCTLDSCNATDGCVHTPAGEGTPCDDMSACTMDTTCNASALCGGGTTRSCEDANPCTADSCEPATGCVYGSVGAGVSCDDGDLCTTGTTCNASDSCGGGSATSCDDSDPCTADSCDPIAGCTHVSLAPGASCDDGDPCTGGDVCSAIGECAGTIVPTCVDAGVPGDAGANADAGATDGAIADGGIADGGIDMEGGCSCRAAGAPARTPWAIAFMALLGLAIVARARRT